MNILFLSSGFPGQFKVLAQFFGKNKKNKTLFVTTDITQKELQLPGVKKIIIAEKSSKEDKGGTPLKGPPGLPVANFMVSLKKQNFIPDIIIGQSGSGMSLHVKDVFPQTPFLCFFEWYHGSNKLSENFEPGSDQELKAKINFTNKNMPILADLVACDSGICPAAWPKSQFPKEFDKKLNIVHSGIDTQLLKPSTDQTFKTENLDLSGVKQLVTYASNLLAPYKGVDQFMEALPVVLEQKPDAHVVILGADRVAFKEPEGDKKSYKSMILEKVKLDLDKVHFIDHLAYEEYIKLLQASAVHVYIDSPLVVSRPLLEAMACECLVLAPDIAPVHEVIKDGTNGMIVDFSSSEKIAQKIINCLDFPSFMEKVKQKARKTILDGYNIENTISEQLSIIKKMVKLDIVKPEKDKTDQFG